MPWTPTPLTIIGNVTEEKQAPQKPESWDSLNDEERILAALHHKPPGVQKPLAPFKVEVHWGSKRTVHGPNHGAILIWESGKRFHGGGDEKMYWCGYPDCEMPIASKFFAHFHAVCPHCKREVMLDNPSKRSFTGAKGFSQGQLDPIKRMPVVIGERFYNLTTRNWAKAIAKVWINLGSSADIYMKYHKSDIRCRFDKGSYKNIDIYEKARQVRRDGLLIYPLARLQKDLAAGADLEVRIFAMCTA